MQPHQRLPGRGLRSCRAGDGLDEAARIMWEHDCGCLVVFAEDDPEQVVGLLSDRDVCMAALHFARELAALQVRDAMSSEVAWYGVREALDAAEAALLNSQARPLALLDEEGRVLGMLSLTPMAGLR